LTGPLKEGWLEDHPYLRPIARLCARVDRTVSDLGLAEVTPPAWDAFRDDLEAGTPLLVTPSAAVDLEPAAAAVPRLLRSLQAGPLPDSISSEVSALAAELARTAELPRRVVSFLLGDDSVELPSPGLLRFLGWMVLAKALRSVVDGFAGGGDEERWLRRYCPTCGAGPAMGQFAGTDQARHRLLCCGRCRTRWRWRRTQCPFCENDSHRLAGIKIEAEPALRIDYCPECSGYLKTYLGEGEESLLLADWTTLHLDLLARQRGLKREATSLYDLESLLLG
jgi:FdhE protein